MARGVQLSLAHKCQLLFGAAVVLILTAALLVVWQRMELLVDEGQREIARKFASAWLDDKIQLGGFLMPGEDLVAPTTIDENMTLTLAEQQEFDLLVSRVPEMASIIELFQNRTERNEVFDRLKDEQGRRYYRYVRAIRKSDLSRIRGGAAAGFEPTTDSASFADPLKMLLVIQLQPDLPAQQVLMNRVSVVAAGLLACLLAIAVFWFISTRLILSPVRVLRETAQQVAAGDLNLRAEVHTGDEFEQLADMFNQMLTTLKQNQDQLRSINKSLDLKLGELAETNVTLYEANKVKGEFLANVSHELRTPLNSIVGFAEVLQETLKDRTGPVDEKRKRYLSNIITSSRRLLDLINDLLDLAKIEAGRMEIRVAPMSVADTLEGLLNLMRPQAEKQDVELVLKVAPRIPLVETDASRFQQIIFNFLSNAMKFTPSGERVTLSAALETRTEEDESGAARQAQRLRVSVSDRGPGLSESDRERIFDKFTQLDPSVTREHGGTGLGLTISQELASLLQCEIEVDSEPGRGATFSLIMPLKLREQGAASLMPSAVSPQGAEAVPQTGADASRA